MPITPGPWSVVPAISGNLIEGPGGANQRVVRGSGGIRNEDDARLIAAAPELLAAAEQMTHYLVVSDKERVALKQRLIDVIKKARGES